MGATIPKFVQRTGRCLGSPFLLTWYGNWVAHMLASCFIETAYTRRIQSKITYSAKDADASRSTVPDYMRFFMPGLCAIWTVIKSLNFLQTTRTGRVWLHLVSDSYRMLFFYICSKIVIISASYSFEYETWESSVLGRMRREFSIWVHLQWNVGTSWNRWWDTYFA